MSGPAAQGVPLTSWDPDSGKTGSLATLQKKEFQDQPV